MDYNLHGGDNRNTTIAAISTAVSASGIGIIRISGPEAMDVISRIYRSKGGKKKIKEVLREAGLHEQVARCQAVEGIGFLTATALVMAFMRGEFKSSDS